MADPEAEPGKKKKEEALPAEVSVVPAGADPEAEEDHHRTHLHRRRLRPRRCKGSDARRCKARRDLPGVA